MCWENYFAQLIMKVKGKRKPFKTNNSSGSCMVCTFLMPLLWEGKLWWTLWENVAQQFISFTIVLNTILLSRRALFAALLWGRGSLHSVNPDWIYY